MAEENQIQIEIVLDDGSVRQGFARIRDEAEKSSSFIGNAFKIRSFTDLFFSVSAVRQAFSQLSGVIKEAVNESIQAEQATLKLTQALATIPGQTQASVDAFTDFSQSLADLVGIDNDVINANAALLASLGRLSGVDLQNATKAALDLSAGLGIGLEDAFRKVAIAAQGNTGQFTRLGFEISKTGSDAQKFTQVLQQIESRFGGLAQATAAGTFEGALRRVSVAFSNVQETIGNAITSSPAIRELFNFIADGLNKASKAIAEFAGTGGINSLVIQTIRFGQTIVDWLIRPLELFGNITVKVFEGVDLAFKSAINLVASLAGQIADLFQFVGLNNPLIQQVQEIRDATRTVYEDAVAATADTRNLFETPISNQIAASVSELAVRVENAKPSLQSFKAVSKEAFESVQKDAIITVQAIKQVLAGGLSSAFQEVGRRLQAGEGLFDDFGNAIVGIIGDLLITVGNALIVQGLAIEAFVSSINSLLPGSGLAAAAAGVGLVVFGSALKASVGKGGAGGAPAPTGGGGAVALPGGGVELPPTAIEETTAARTPQQGLTVNINGDVLGDEASGQRLVQLINSAFDASGVSLRTGVV